MRTRQRGTSLVEVMLSMGVVLVGMVALARVLVTSITGSAIASRLTHAQLRCASVVETLRLEPRATLDCLAATTSARWASCDARLALPSSDRNGQRYAIDPSSAVTKVGGAFDLFVVVTFDDAAHRSVALRTGVYP